MAQGLSAGIRFFQYRDKNGSRRSVYEASLALAGIARSEGALFIVNDHADIAAAVDAHGVHLGQDDLPIGAAKKIAGTERIIGISTHSREEALRAEEAGADYIGFGPIFTTQTKDAGQAQGLAALSALKSSVRIPVIAIGGITINNCKSVHDAGADGMAVISAILSAADPEDAARTMLSIVMP